MALPHRRQIVPVLLLAALVGGSIPATASANPLVPTLVDIRAAQHDGYDRLVFEFSGALPAQRDVAWTDQVVGEFSGLPIPVAGDALLRVRFSPSVGHEDAAASTYGPTRRTYPLPNLIQVVNSGDFEGLLAFGVGLASRTSFTVSTLTSPSRVVIDLGNQFRTVAVNTYFIDNGPLTLRAVSRPVIPPSTAKGALQRLFAGPTQPELAAGLRFVSSDATGFTGLSIVDGVARVRLTGGCNSHGSTVTIASEIFPTLKQFTSVHWVKIYDPAGTTERPSGSSDSIPTCLEP